MKRSTFDFRDKNMLDHNKQIEELEKVISFEHANIKMCFNNAEMKGVCLDLGCGPGTTTEIISECEMIDKVIGIDYDEYFIDYAKKINPQIKQIMRCQIAII